MVFSNPCEGVLGPPKGHDPQTRKVAQAGLELGVLLPQPPEQLRRQALLNLTINDERSKKLVSQRAPGPGSAGSWSEPCLGVFMQWMAQGDAVVADPAGTLVCFFLWSSGEDLPPDDI